MITSQSFRVNFKETFCHISTDSPRLYFPPGYLFNFPSNLYIWSWLAEIFKFILFRWLENSFATQKKKKKKILLMPPGKFLKKRNGLGRKRFIYIIYRYTYTYTYIYVYVYTYTYIYLYICISTNVWCVCVSVCVYVYVQCVCGYTCVSSFSEMEYGLWVQYRRLA